MLSVADRFKAAKRALFDKIYSNLNDKQREAVYTVNGPLLILAGAGSGKTTVLVNRLAYIIRYGDAYNTDFVPENTGEEEIEELEKAIVLPKDEIEVLLDKYSYRPCPPWAALCITFTNKAANEIKERLALTVGDDASEVWAGTFHSVCMRILRKYYGPAGLRSGFTIYDADDAKRLISECIKDLKLDEKIYQPKAVMEQISRAKDKLMTPPDLAAEASKDLRLAGIAKVFEEYQKRLELANAVDFDDIIVRTVRLLMNNAEARDYYQHRFKYVSVDEYQDTNVAQFKLTELLSGKYMNLMAVGDDDQSIYRFRGATIENILNFEKVISGAKIIKLEQNYRSTQNILNAANAVIAHNRGRHDKKLWTSKEEGDKISLIKLDNQNIEARYITDKITELVGSKKCRFSDIAVLYRVNAQSNNIEQAMAKSAMPYRLIGGLRFYERKEIKDMVAYLCVVQNRDDNIRLKRIINEPKRKIGDTAIAAVEQLAYHEGKSMYDVISSAMQYPALARYADKLLAFSQLIEQLGKVKENGSVSELIDMTYILSGYKQMLDDSGFEGKERAENVKELVSNAVYYEKEHEGASLEGFLEDVALVADVDNYDKDADAVTLMTIHSAKGLEFPIVFLPGMEEGLFPIAQSTVYPDELEEERRMAYVAYTRAKKKIYCSYVRERLLYGRTQYNSMSRFIEEVPSEYIDEETGGRRSTDRHSAGTHSYGSTRISEGSLSKEFTSRFDIPGKNTAKSVTAEKFAEGDRVVHPTFGEGTVMSVRLMGADVLYEIAFDNAGTKKLMATYAKLKRA
ncbi:MAG: ATP-dependent DNA helicase PcrA [Ruminococcaceae bacterium]|nr:ATP-dependent DNA helicase PcrA [Oscillospiraceae bacterium]